MWGVRGGMVQDVGVRGGMVQDVGGEGWYGASNDN